MAQDLAQALYIEADFHTPGGEGVPERVEIHFLDSYFLENLFKMILQYPGLCYLHPISGQDKARFGCIHIPQQRFQIFRQRDRPLAAYGFRRSDDHSGFGA